MLIGISGKIGSGKDTVGKIIQSLVAKDYGVYKSQLDFIQSDGDWVRQKQSGIVIKKFADTLKDMVCMLLGCTREQLEDHDFKNTELGEEWWYWQMKLAGGYGNIALDYLTTTKEQLSVYEGLELIKPTPRLLLQQLGTDCGRNIIHPDVWVNALFSRYNVKGFNYTGAIGVKYRDWETQ